MQPATPSSSPPPRTVHLPLVLAGLVLAVLASIGAWLLPEMAMAPSAVPPALAVHEDRGSPRLTTDTPNKLRLSSAGPEWQDITAAQRQILEPLHLQWPAMGALTKRRWLVLANRYPHMDEKEQAKLHERMLSWASLSAQQRNQARLNFENAKRLTPDELLAKWQEYQALTAAEKERLKAEGLKAEQARKAKNTRRKLMRSKPTVRPAPTVVAPAQVEALPLETPPHAASTSVVTPPQPVQATPLPPLIEAAPAPVEVPQQMYTMELPPLPVPPAAPEAPTAPATPAAPPPLPSTEAPTPEAPSATPAAPAAPASAPEALHSQP